jgi:predicted XRE-type DNA-binding protein
MSKEETFKTGTGDIFRDFGFSDEEAAALTIKASLFRTLQKALKEAPGTQAEIAARIGAPQPKVSDILNGKMAGFSVERLVNYLLKLDYEICLDAHPAPVGATGRVIDRSELATA